MAIKAQDQEIQSLVNDIKEGRLLLPELQRGYVWKSTQVKDLFDSLYHEYPTGQLLVWQTDELPYGRTAAIQDVERAPYHPNLLLDGQQRLTSLAAVLLGQPLVVRDRTRDIDIVFHVFDEKFEVATAFHHPQGGWVSLRKLFTRGSMAVFGDLKLDFNDPSAQPAHDRLTRLEGIRHYRYRINVLDNLSYDEVTDIFVRINSGGTRLNKSDLVLAQISSRWHGITDELDSFRQWAKSQGWELDYSILLRTLSAFQTNQSRLNRFFLSARDKLTVDDLQAAWARAVPAMKQAIHFLIHNCLIDRLEMMPTDYVLVTLAKFFDRFGESVTENQARNLQRWLYMALIWSRYSGSSETFLDEDLAALAREDEPIQRMIVNIEDRVGKRPVSERELRDQLNNSPFMLMTYVLARHNGAKDWFNGVVIGSRQNLEYHHIFPKALLSSRYDLRAQSRIINQVANLAFISGHTNVTISAKSPDAYLAKIEDSRLRAQYVPDDRSLWTLDRYEDFLLARRTLLAEAINQFLQSLSDAPSLVAPTTVDVIENRIGALERQLRDIIADRLVVSFGSRAWKQGVPGDTKSAIEPRIATRERLHPYEAGAFDTLEAKLAFGQFSEYARIITANWPLFEPLFRDRQNFDRHLRDVQNVRNALAHNRDTNRSELSHADGGLAWLEDTIRYAQQQMELEDQLDDVEVVDVAAPAMANAQVGE